jgi:hypothetical protein
VVEIIPLWLVNVLSFITVFSVMAAIGTTITPSVSIRHLRSPSLLVRGLVIVLAIGFATTITFGLTLPEQVGAVLMAPVRRSRCGVALASGACPGLDRRIRCGFAQIHRRIVRAVGRCESARCLVP